MYKVIIVDDEPHAQELLSSSIEKFFPEKFQILAKCFSADEAFTEINRHRPDLLFLDIQMPQKSGLDLLDELGDFEFPVIFTTAYDNFAIKAIKHQAFDYLLKPLDISELKKSIIRFEKELQKTNSISTSESDGKIGKDLNILKFSSQKSDQFVCIDDIIYFQADKNYTNVITANSEKILVTKPLNTYDFLLNDKRFLQISKSNIVNVNYFKEFDKSSSILKLKDGSDLNVSYRRMAELKKHFE